MSFRHQKVGGVDERASEREKGPSLNERGAVEKAASRSQLVVLDTSTPPADRTCGGPEQ